MIRLFIALIAPSLIIAAESARILAIHDGTFADVLIESKESRGITISGVNQRLTIRVANALCESPTGAGAVATLVMTVVNGQLVQLEPDPAFPDESTTKLVRRVNLNGIDLGKLITDSHLCSTSVDAVSSQVPSITTPSRVAEVPPKNDSSLSEARNPPVMRTKEVEEVPAQEASAKSETEFLCIPTEPRCRIENGVHSLRAITLPDMWVKVITVSKPAIGHSGFFISIKNSNSARSVAVSLRIRERSFQPISDSQITAHFVKAASRSERWINVSEAMTPQPKKTTEEKTTSNIDLQTESGPVRGTVTQRTTKTEVDREAEQRQREDFEKQRAVARARAQNELASARGDEFKCWILDPDQSCSGNLLFDARSKGDSVVLRVEVGEMIFDFPFAKSDKR